MVEKESPTEFVHRDTRAVELFIHDKLERHANHALLRGLGSQLEQIVPNPVTRSVLPALVRVHARGDSADQLVQLSPGALCWVNLHTGEASRVFPPAFSVVDLFLCSHVVDRVSTNVCMMSLAQHAGLIWTPWGFFHDLWNGLKAAAKAQ